MTHQPLLSPVAFLGLGALGTPMAARLQAAGFPLTVHNRSRAAEQPLVALGARAAASPAAAARGAALLCLCLRDDAAVEAVLFGPPDSATGAPEPAIAGLAPGTQVIDFSTVAPATSRALAQRLAAHGVAYLDAPVTGGTEGARAGSLSVLVGGALADLERARPLLQAIGGSINHFGPVGAGQAAKAVNQVLVAGNTVAAAEALALGQRLGLPMELVLQALGQGAAASWTLQHRGSGMVRGQFPLGFKLELHRKDLGIALAEAEAVGLELPVASQVAALEEALMAAGFGADDVSALIRAFQR